MANGGTVDETEQLTRELLDENPTDTPVTEIEPSLKCNRLLRPHTVLPDVTRVDVTATLTQGRQHFSEFLDLVRDGKNILFIERGKARAMMTPVPRNICTKSSEIYKKNKLYKTYK